MRLLAVRAVTAMYSHPDNHALLSSFTSRFTPRYRELPYDVDVGVAVLGVSVGRGLQGMHMAVQ